MIIRLYKDSDLLYIKKICQDTAINGFDKSGKKRELVYLMYLAYYVEFEKTNCLVLVDDNGLPHGYIVFSTNPKLYEEKMRNYIRKKIFKGSFFVGLFSIFQDKISFNLNEKYNGGFHINIDKENQGMKYGPKLLDAAAVKIKECGGKYMYLVTKNKKTKGYPFYIHYGFVEVKKYPFGSLSLKYKLK